MKRIVDLQVPGGWGSPALLATAGRILMEDLMRTLFRTATILLVSLGLASALHAQEDKRNIAVGVFAEVYRPALTGKERLGPKWTDEQRIDNCHVPTDKRGQKPRPSACANRPSS